MLKQTPAPDPDDWILRPNLYVGFYDIKNREEWTKAERCFMLEGRCRFGLGESACENEPLVERIRGLRGWARGMRETFEAEGIDPLSTFVVEVKIRCGISTMLGAPRYDTMHNIYVFTDPSEVPDIPANAGVSCPRDFSLGEPFRGSSRRILHYQDPERSQVIRRAFSHTVRSQPSIGRF